MSITRKYFLFTLQVLLTVWLELSCVVSAQDSVIDGPSLVAAGDLVVLKANRAANAYEWILVNQNRQFLQMENNRCCIFSSGKPGKYDFVLVTVSLNDNQKPDVQIYRHRVTVEPLVPVPIDPSPIEPSPVNPEPIKPEPVGPPEPPTPDIPDPALPELSIKVMQMVRSNGLSQIRLKKEARQLAESFRSVASQIESDRTQSHNEILSMTRESNRAALGSSAKDWMSFFKALDTELRNRWNSDRRQWNASDYVLAWERIARGLKEAAQ